MDRKTTSGRAGRHLAVPGQIPLTSPRASAAPPRTHTHALRFVAVVALIAAVCVPSVGSVRAASPPTVTTPTVASIKAFMATLGGDVTSDGGASLIKRGVVYALTGTNPNPQIGGTGVTEVDNGSATTGVFTDAVMNLLASSDYSFAAFATNSVDTSYSSVAVFKTALRDQYEEGTSDGSISPPGYIAEVFTAGLSGTLTTVRVQMQSTAVQPIIVTVGIYNVVNGVPSTVIVNSNTISVSANAPAQWYTVNLANAPTVTAGTQYALVLSLPGPGISVPTVSAAARTATTDYAVTSNDSRNWTVVSPTQSLLFDDYVLITDRTAPTTTITAQPNPRTNQTSASFTFSATDPDDPANTLTYQCKLDTGAFTACTSPQPYTGLSFASHTFIVEATDPFGNTETPGTNQTVTWVVDNTAPTTTITAQPNARTNSTSASFTFAATDPDDASNTLTYQCKLDTGAFAACTSPQPYTGLAAGSHTFIVEASDPVGNTETPGANQTVTWVIDTTAPSTTITAKPNARTNQTAADFTFSATDPDDAANTLTYQCKLDTGAFTACTSPQHYAGPLADGSHTFVVEASDPAGNTETPGTNQTVTWTVDTTVPTVAIDSGPTQPGTISTSATFAFHGSDPDGVSDPLTFQCKLDTGTFAACTSPTPAYTNLPDGSHTFTVQATDSAGNLSTPATYTWTVAAHPATIALGNPAGSPQQATVTTAFAQPLQVVVKNSLGQPLSGITVTFTVTPAASGATAALTTPTTTDASGLTSVVATANTVAGGPYTVTANVSPALGTPATFTLTNVAAVVTHLAIGTPNTAPPPANVKVGENAMLTAMATFSNNTTGDVTASVTWTSSDPKIATVDASGKVTGVSSGTVTITATLNGVTQTITITIPAPVPVGITVPTGRPSGTASQPGGTPAPAPGGTASPAPSGPAPNPVPIGR